MTKYNFATANLSFVLALGGQFGSEAKWLKKIIKDAQLSTPEEQKKYLQDKAKGVMEKIVDKLIGNEIDAIGLQELNGLANGIGIETFIKKMESEFRTDRKSFDNISISLSAAGGEVSIVSINKYCIISFGTVYSFGVPTVALIYNMEKLGMPTNIFCEDCVVAGQNGRPMLGVITEGQFGLISMHAPNVNPYLTNKENIGLSALMNSEEMIEYFNGKEKNETIESSLYQINQLIDTEFMTPMVNKITNFINKLDPYTNKIVLMGDMNDPYPNKENSLSNKVGLQFKPGKPTCCYNWDSSKRDNDKPEYTQWIIGNGHPDDKINEEKINKIINEDSDLLEKIKNEKSKKSNYDFTGDLIYFSANFTANEEQKELFTQENENIPSQYSDHIFQQISLEDNSNNGGKKKKKTKKYKHTKKLANQSKKKKIDLI